MRLFTSESLFNIKTGHWEERFWIDGIITDGDEYFFQQDREKQLEADKLLKECEFEEDDDCCDCLECTLDYFVERIQETGCECEGCIRQVLVEFLCEIVDHIVVEDIEDDD